jgi:hypothetical protein
MDDILVVIREKATEMELRGVMKDVAYDPFAAMNRIGSAPQQR